MRGGCVGRWLGACARMGRFRCRRDGAAWRGVRRRRRRRRGERAPAHAVHTQPAADNGGVHRCGRACAFALHSVRCEDSLYAKRLHVVIVSLHGLLSRGLKRLLAAYAVCACCMEMRHDLRSCMSNFPLILAAGVQRRTSHIATFVTLGLMGSIASIMLEAPSLAATLPKTVVSSSYDSEGNAPAFAAVSPGQSHVSHTRQAV
eukprot:5176466-Pleurochrysis_carterae.AAC.2